MSDHKAYNQMLAFRSMREASARLSDALAARRKYGTDADTLAEIERTSREWIAAREHYHRCAAAS